MILAEGKNTYPKDKSKTRLKKRKMTIFIITVCVLTRDFIIKPDLDLARGLESRNEATERSDSIVEKITREVPQKNTKKEISITRSATVFI